MVRNEKAAAKTAPSLSDIQNSDSTLGVMGAHAPYPLGVSRNARVLFEPGGLECANCISVFATAGQNQKRAARRSSKSARLSLGNGQHWPVTVPPLAAAADALQLSIQQSIFLVNVVISLAVCRWPQIALFAI
jgi:hypothetical protein